MTAPLPVLLLPGMDGTGEFLASFAATAPAGLQPMVVPLGVGADYAEIEAAVRKLLPSEGRFLMVAESFSGPVAVRIAASEPDRVALLVLSNTFVSAPRSRLYGLFPWSLIFRLPPPQFAIRLLLLGRFSTKAKLQAVRRVASRISPEVMARRVRAALRVNDLPLLKLVSVPLLYLRGTEDRLVLDRSADEIIRGVPGAVRKDFTAPHVLLQSVPEQAWAAIRESLSRSETASSSVAATR